MKESIKGEQMEIEGLQGLNESLQQQKADLDAMLNSAKRIKWLPSEFSTQDREILALLEN